MVFGGALRSIILFNFVRMNGAVNAGETWWRHHRHGPKMKTNMAVRNRRKFVVALVGLPLSLSLSVSHLHHTHAPCSTVCFGRSCQYAMMPSAIVLDSNYYYETLPAATDDDDMEYSNWHVRDFKLNPNYYCFIIISAAHHIHAYGEQKKMPKIGNPPLSSKCEANIFHNYYYCSG